MEYRLISIFNKLVGDIMAHGSHGSDMYNYEKLDDVAELLDDIIGKLIQNAKNKDSVSQSISLVGVKSFDILCSLKEAISEVVQ